MMGVMECFVYSDANDIACDGLVLVCVGLILPLDNKAYSRLHL